MVRQAKDDAIKSSSSYTWAHLANNLYLDMMKEMYHRKIIGRDKNLENNCTIWRSLQLGTQSLRVVLNQASASMLRQLRNDASDTAPIENNGVTTEWGYTLFSSDSIVFNEGSIASVIAELS